MTDGAEGSFGLFLFAGIAAFVLGWTMRPNNGFDHVSDFLQKIGSRQSHNGTGGGGLTMDLLGAPSSALFRGQYRLLSTVRIDVESKSKVSEEGTLIMKLVSQQTSIESVQILSIAMELLKDGRTSFPSSQSDLVFNGISFSNAGQLTATGNTSAERFRRAHPQHRLKACRVDAVVNRVDLALSQAKREASDALGFLGDSSGSIAGEVTAVECGCEVCGFSVIFTAEAVSVRYLTQKVVLYAIWVSLLTLLQIRCFLVQMRHTEEGASAAKVSILCLVMLATMDAYESFLHLCLALYSPYMFNTFAAVSLFKFMLFLFEAGYLLTIWRQRYRRESCWISLLSSFNGVCTIGMFLIYIHRNKLAHLHWIALAFQAYWVPQIFRDAWYSSRNALHPAFVIGISVTRSLLMLYLWGCPQSIFSDEVYPRLPGAPSLKVCGGVVLMQVLQVTVMMLQEELGPRWFMPWDYQAYNYYRLVRIENGTECVICMSEVPPGESVYARMRRVVTPCNHNFHAACLEQWMDIKMKCPTCRKTLPPNME